MRLYKFIEHYKLFQLNPTTGQWAWEAKKNKVPYGKMFLSITLTPIASVLYAIYTLHMIGYS